MQPVPSAPTAAEDGGLSTHVLHMTRPHAKRPLLVELRVINGLFEGGCRLQSGGGAWLACNTSVHDTREDTRLRLVCAAHMCEVWQVLSPISRPISRLYLAYISPISPPRVERVCKSVCCASHFPTATAEWDVLMVMLAKTQDTL